MSQKIFKLSYRYNNYKTMLSNMENKDIELDNDINYLSSRMQKYYQDFLEIKQNILKSNSNNYKTYFDSHQFNLIVQSLENISNKYKIEGLFISDKILHDEIKSYFSNLKDELEKNIIDLDYILGAFRLVNLERELASSSKYQYKVSSYGLKQNESLDDKVFNIIYGQDFESLNRKFLSETFGMKFDRIDGILEWDALCKIHQYNVWRKDYRDENIDYKSWLNIKDMPFKYRANLASMDLKARINEQNIYVENKNYNGDRNGTFFLNFHHSASQIVDRLNNLAVLSRDNSQLLFNINIYSDKNKEFFSYMIPINDLKKFYQKVDKKINQYLKSFAREGKIFKDNIVLDWENNNKNMELHFDIRNQKESDRLNIRTNIQDFHDTFGKFLINDIKKDGILDIKKGEQSIYLIDNEEYKEEDLELMEF